jgi:hypothetical protein
VTSIRRLLTLLALAMAAATSILHAQDKPTASSASVGRTSAPTLHQAWLAEVMDLDSRRAAEIYREVARDNVPDNLERWVAIARLAELHRLGVTKAPAIDPTEVPAVLRAPLAAAQVAIDVNALVRHAESDPAALLQGLGGESAKLPLLRPAVFEAQAWLISQVGPNYRDRFRQRQPDRGRFYDRFWATNIVVAELEGRRGQADEVRALYFTQWRPPTVSNDPNASLARVRSNLATLLRGREMNGSQNLLRRLGDAIEKAAATDPSAAVALVLRLPYFAEQLLQSTEGR